MLRNPALLVVWATFFYAVENKLVERYLTGIHPLLTSAILSAGVAVSSTILYQAMKLLGITIPGTGVPQSSLVIGILLASGVICSLAELCYFGAYTQKVPAIMVTTIVIMIPVFVALIDVIAQRQLPPLRIIAGWVCAGFSIWLVSSAGKPLAP